METDIELIVVLSSSLFTPPRLLFSLWWTPTQALSRPPRGVHVMNGVSVHSVSSKVFNTMYCVPARHAVFERAGPTRCAAQQIRYTVL